MAQQTPNRDRDHRPRATGHGGFCGHGPQADGAAARGHTSRPQTETETTSHGRRATAAFAAKGRKPTGPPHGATQKETQITTSGQHTLCVFFTWERFITWETFIPPLDGLMHNHGTEDGRNDGGTAKGRDEGGRRKERGETQRRSTFFYLKYPHRIGAGGRRNPTQYQPYYVGNRLKDYYPPRVSYLDTRFYSFFGIIDYLFNLLFSNLNFHFVGILLMQR